MVAFVKRGGRGCCQKDSSNTRCIKILGYNFFFLKKNEELIIVGRYN